MDVWDKLRKGPAPWGPVAIWIAVSVVGAPLAILEQGGGAALAASASAACILVPAVAVEMMAGLASSVAWVEGRSFDRDAHRPGSLPPWW